MGMGMGMGMQGAAAAAGLGGGTGAQLPGAGGAQGAHGAQGAGGNLTPAQAQRQLRQAMEAALEAQAGLGGDAAAASASAGGPWEGEGVAPIAAFRATRPVEAGACGPCGCGRRWMGRQQQRLVRLLGAGPGDEGARREACAVTPAEVLRVLEQAGSCAGCLGRVRRMAEVAAMGQGWPDFVRRVFDVPGGKGALSSIFGQGPAEGLAEQGFGAGVGPGNMGTVASSGGSSGGGGGGGRKRGGGRRRGRKKSSGPASQQQGGGSTAGAGAGGTVSSAAPIDSRCIALRRDVLTHPRNVDLVARLFDLKALLARQSGESPQGGQGALPGAQGRESGGSGGGA